MTKVCRRARLLFGSFPRFLRGSHQLSCWVSRDLGRQTGNSGNLAAVELRISVRRL